MEQMSVYRKCVFNISTCISTSCFSEKKSPILSYHHLPWYQHLCVADIATPLTAWGTLFPSGIISCSWSSVIFSFILVFYIHYITFVLFFSFFQTSLLNVCGWIFFPVSPTKCLVVVYYFQHWLVILWLWVFTHQLFYPNLVFRFFQCVFLALVMNIHAK